MIILIYLILPWVDSFDRIQLVSAIMRYESMDNRTRYVHLASKSNYLYRIYIFSVQGGWNTLRGYYVLHKLYLRTKGEQSAKKKGGCNHLDIYILSPLEYITDIFSFIIHDGMLATVSSANRRNDRTWFEKRCSPPPYSNCNSKVYTIGINYNFI